MAFRTGELTVKLVTVVLVSISDVEAHVVNTGFTGKLNRLDPTRVSDRMKPNRRFSPSSSRPAAPSSVVCTKLAPRQTPQSAQRGRVQHLLLLAGL